MYFEKVDREPKIRGKLDKQLEEFMKTGNEMALCHFEEGRYSNPYIAAHTWNRAAKHWGFPVKAFVRERQVYLIRTDK